jgi:hypothetical protein
MERDRVNAAKAEKEAQEARRTVMIPHYPEAYSVDWNSTTPEHPDDLMARNRRELDFAFDRRGGNNATTSEGMAGPQGGKTR